jgi:hypothetical protein
MTALASANQNSTASWCRSVHQRNLLERGWRRRSGCGQVRGDDHVVDVHRLVGPESQRPDLDLDRCAGRGDLAVDLEQVPGSVGEQDPGLACCGGLATGELGETQEHRTCDRVVRICAAASTCVPRDADWITGMAMPYSARPVLGSVVAGTFGSRCTRAWWAGSAALPLVRNAPGNGRQAATSWSKLASSIRFLARLVAAGLPVCRWLAGGRRRRTGYGHRGQPGEEQNDHHQGGHTE